MAGFLKRLGVTPGDLEEALKASASLRGILLGYLAEKKVVEKYFKSFNPTKPDDHDRSSKGDRVIIYKGTSIRIEVKSLQTNSVRQTALDGYAGRFQCDASDSGTKTLPNGDVLKIVCLVVGGFDLLAVNLFEFGQQWRFAFVHNFDLPRSSSPKYTPAQQNYLLQTTPPITWPLQPPYESEPWSLLDRIVQEKALRKP
jgi:hypothetical protein